MHSFLLMTVVVVVVSSVDSRNGQSDIGGDGNAVVIVQSFIGLFGWSTLEPD